jgi:hypothetical protein
MSHFELYGEPINVAGARSNLRKRLVSRTVVWILVAWDAPDILQKL